MPLETTLFYVADRASFVFTRVLRGVKGSDASNLFDEEINDEVAFLRSKANIIGKGIFG